MDQKIKDFLKQNKQLFQKPKDQIEWEKIYKRVSDELSYPYAGDFTKIMLDSGIHPEYYLSELPKCFLWKAKISSFAIPGNITRIGICAFKFCSNLKSVTIPNNVTLIDQGAFDSCESLMSVEIPNSVTRIAYSAFHYCHSLTSVTIGNGVELIGGDVFSYCTSLVSVTIPNSVKSIGSTAFYNCKSLESMTIPGSVISIGERAFSKCGDNLVINYKGTKAQFRVLTKGVFKDTYFIAHCVDGDIIKKRK